MTPLAGLSLSPTWLRGDAWRDAPERAREYVAGAGAVAVARRAEDAGWDYLLKPDVPELPLDRVGRGPEFVGPDPLTLMSVIAGATERIRLFPTCSTTFSRPYQLARELRSFDALSGGRAGWNAVWSLAGHGNFGVELDGDAQARLAAAHAALEVLHELWAGFDDAALVADAGTGEFVRVAVFTAGAAQAAAGVAGPLTLPGRPSLPMLTAGGSPQLLEFAARWADAVFAATPDARAARAVADELARRAEAAGRPAGAVGPHPGVIVSVREGGPAPLPSADGAGARHFVATGTPADASERIAEFLHDAGVPGFIALPFGGWESLERTVDEVLPRVRELLG
ncbi:LLM class flavin-dependent oxidoreductase [Gulosibacter faecalis]|uniref:LLM class flavin-dependent oxidoreductase n=1 Tax=Gulosibacter faecalis TaxID=272240 RepID=A0ABW5V070_9MICO